MHSWGLDHSSRAQKNAILQFEHCSRIFIYDETFYFHVSLRHNFAKYFFFVIAKKMSLVRPTLISLWTIQKTFVKS